MTKQCTTCGADFQALRAQRNCESCRQRTCETCGTAFVAERAKRRYCSRRCSDADHLDDYRRLARHWREVPSGCWIWTGSSSSDGLGYGMCGVRTADGSWKTSMAHRAVYEILNGPIPSEMHLDHLCRVPACVNPSHLEPVTPAENNRRAALHRKGDAA